MVLLSMLCSAQTREIQIFGGRTSQEAWWVSQYGRIPLAWTEATGGDYENRNSGPACVVMLLNYKKRSEISTDFGSFSDPRYPKIHAEARWTFCRANKDKGYPGGFPDDDEVEVTGEDLLNVLEHEDIPAMMYKGTSQITIDRIIGAVERNCPVICRVNASEYFADEKTGSSRWVVVHGHDDKFVYIHDPGRTDGKAKKVMQQDFLAALHNADSGKNIVMLECVTLIGNYIDSWHANGSSMPFIEGYRKFREFLGVPINNGGEVFVHNIGSCVAQDFQQLPDKPRHGKEGKSLLFFNQPLVETFLLKGEFYDAYVLIWGFEKLGTPKSNEYQIKDGGVRQDFEKGSLIWNGKDVVVKAKK
jgi:hypothetical protein